jgi:hypothetical protein
MCVYEIWVFEKVSCFGFRLRSDHAPLCALIMMFFRKVKWNKVPAVCCIQEHYHYGHLKKFTQVRTAAMRLEA